MNKNNLYAFYGSLRPGMYNANAFQRMYGDFEIVAENYELRGYKMYSLSSYPFCVKTNNNDDLIKVTLVRLHNPAQEASIHRMEIGAGYVYDEAPTDVAVNLDNHKVNNASFGIYLYPNNHNYDARYDTVPNGDWVSFKS